MVDEQLLARIDALLQEGKALINTATRASQSDLQANIEKFHHWKSQTLSLLTRNLGEGDHYVEEFLEISRSRRLGPLQGAHGILRALRDDVANGYLARFATLVSAEVFADFLGMAEHLLDNHYYQPAASLIGAVLEDGMRRIAQTHKVMVKREDDVSTLNQKLVQASVYTQIVRKEVQVWTDIRNSADHGKFDEFTETQVNDMHRGVSRFLTEHL